MVHTEHAMRRFADIGARLRVGRLRRNWRTATYRLDVVRDRKLGEYFTLDVTDDTPIIHVPQANRAARHLLLSVGKDHFLCGHDERHWFAAGLRHSVSGIMEARRSLLPHALRHLPMTTDQLARRHNDVYIRQGEWFFVKTDKTFPDSIIHHSEPISRGRGSKPHLVAELVRFGGQRVALFGGKEYTESEWGAREHHGDRPDWRTKDAEVYARGKVRHADHATITLDGWHRVHMNGEWNVSPLAFYD